jgi:hypothetical protein
MDTQLKLPLERAERPCLDSKSVGPGMEFSDEQEMSYNDLATLSQYFIVLVGSHVPGFHTHFSELTTSRQPEHQRCLVSISCRA